MKKSLAPILSLVMIAALSACGSTGTTPAVTNAPAETTTAEATNAPQSDSANAPAETTTAEATNAPASDSAKESAETTTAEVKNSEAEEPSGGFQEFPIWEDEEVGFLNVNGVYFQPVPMSNGNESIEGFSMHFEADVAAMENDLGYGVGDWVPYMTVDYELIGSDGKTAASGSFMPMNADDGPHYGANIPVIPADTYSVKLTFHSPEENGYLIHLDGETGPGGNLDEYWGDGPMVLELKDVWDYTPQEW